ncbi:hypothetical protein CVT24_002292 [Panaeolus cyanescens]|uniref:Fungal-type protein kinase domain-containing protein n=1 Tax=Panaeolus cyanescens TaxID=181874 RepID=A0A409YIN2_9AGAR|nr:hypothetical protein CVT24_002292 [Panaeolus cyanescens]
MDHTHPPTTPLRSLRESTLISEHERANSIVSDTHTSQRVESTPRANRLSNGPIQGFSTVREASEAIRAEMNLAPERELTSDDLDNLLRSVATEAEIAGYLRSASSPYTKQKGWKFLAEVERSHKASNTKIQESDLYEPLVGLFNNVLKYFKPQDETRSVHNTARVRIEHSNGLDQTDQTGDNNTKKKLKSSPDLFAMVHGGIYFPVIPEEDRLFIRRRKKGVKGTTTEMRPTYKLCGSPIEVKRDDNHDGEDHFKAQCGLYARECFIQQTGRRFVFVPLITESRIRLYRFDRGGVLISPWVNYHKRPHVLVRIILLACAQSEVDLGVNPAITWNDGKRYITINDLGIQEDAADSPSPVERRYEILENQFLSRAIRGRGTCVWRVLDENKKECVVKYLWRAERRTPEWELLVKLRNEKGVATILGRSEESSLFAIRNFTPEIPFVGEDRLACFIVLESYGPPITQFTSVVQFLEGFRDAIEGHRNMWKKGILHRDISINNILYGKEGNDNESRGVLIDMDLVIFFDRMQSLSKADWLTGTHAFQSVHVLESGLPTTGFGDKFVPVHDYIDDLESFFWVFCWVTIGYSVSEDGSAAEITPLPPCLESFQADSRQASDSKFKGLFKPRELHAHQSWPHQINLLQVEMAEFLQHYYTVKEEPVEGEVTRDSLAIPSEEHYKTFIKYIQDAIDSLKNRLPAKPIGKRKWFNFREYDEMIAEKKAEARLALASSTLSDSAQPSSDATAQPDPPSTPPPTTNLDACIYSESPLTDEDEKDVLPTLQGERTPGGGLRTPAPLSPSQSFNLATNSRRKRGIDEEDTPTKRIRTPTGSAASPFASQTHTSEACHQQYLRTSQDTGSTPRANLRASEGLIQGFPKAEVALRAEMEFLPGRALTKEELDKLLVSVATEDEIATYLSEEKVYDDEKHEWTFVDQVINHCKSKGRSLIEADLYDPLVNLFNDILNHFPRDTLERRVIKMSRVQSQSSSGLDNSSAQAGQKQFKTSPDLFAMVQGGRHFRPIPRKRFKSTGGSQESDLKPIYEICGSPIEVKREVTHDGDANLKIQCGMYASSVYYRGRACFIQQTGRRFVFVPLVTEKRIQLYRFDRGGALVSPWVDYHENPAVLVRIILLACGQTEVELGANPAITWEGDKRYIIIDDMGINPEEANSDAVQPIRRRYEVTDTMDLSRRICGRGTCIWRVLDEDGKECVVKYIWRAVGSTPEWLNLHDTIGVPRILGRSEEWSLLKLRGCTPDTTFSDHDHIACFIVLESAGYGSPLTEFRSPLHFLQGFHDAIEGHRNMWEVGVLHRDISINNILFGKEGNRVPSHGVVIDLDLGVFFNRTDSLAEVDCQTVRIFAPFALIALLIRSIVKGTHVFQSIHVLDSALGKNTHRTKYAIVHDYIDDLQSFFWVFCWVTMGHEVTNNDTGKPTNKPEELELLDKPGSIARHTKYSFLSDPSWLPLHPSWPAAFCTLRYRMAKFLLHYHKVKSTLKETNKTRGSLAIPSQFHYNTFLGYIKDAISSFNPRIPPTPISADFDFVAYDKMIAEQQAEASGSVIEPFDSSKLNPLYV